MSLYRKYRPQTFNHLVGQDHIIQTLKNALKLQRVSHAYLFTGPRGTGKTSAARLLAKAINCLDLQENEPCNKCEICTEINDGKLIDLIEIDAASNRGIDEIRDLREKISFSPTRAKSKVYIIDEVHMLTKEAFNALLKTLEEPPSHVFFILATTEVHKIPETILSRCQRFDFRRIDDIVLIDRLKYIAKEEGIEAEEKALEIIAHHAEGAMRDAIGLMEQLAAENTLSFDRVCDILGVSGIASIEKLFGFLSDSDANGAIQEIDLLYKQGFDLVFFNKRFLEFIRKELLKSVSQGDQELVERNLKIAGNFQEAYEKARFATIPQLPLEIAVIKSVSEVSQNNKNQDQLRKHQNISGRKPDPQPAAPEITQDENAIGELTLDNILKHWKTIESKVSNPIVKRSLKNCSPLKLEGNSLVLAFSNKFNMDKLLETPNRSEVEKAVGALFNKNLKIIGEIREIEENKKGKAVGDKVLDIFDGELI